MEGKYYWISNLGPLQLYRNEREISPNVPVLYWDFPVLLIHLDEEWNLEQNTGCNLKKFEYDHHYFSLIIIDYHSVPYESDKPHVDTSMIKLCKAHNSAHPPLNGISLLSSSLSSTAVSWVQQRATFLLVYPPPPSTSIGMLNSFTILTHSLETTDQWSFQIVLNIYDFFDYLVVLFILIGGTWYMLFTHKWWRI